MTKTNASRPGAPHWLRGGDVRLVNREDCAVDRGKVLSHTYSDVYDMDGAWEQTVCQLQVACPNMMVYLGSGPPNPAGTSIIILPRKELA